MRRVLIVSSIVVVLAGGAAAWWLTRDTAPPPLSVDDVGQQEPAGSAGPAVTGLDGSWTVERGSDSQAGLRIVEDRFGGLRDNTAVGRTSAVTGEMTVAGTTVSSASFRVDLSKIRFTDDPGLSVADRSKYLQTKSLETDRFPDATFELTKPIQLAQPPRSGARVVASATGDLTLHGVTRSVTFDVEAKPVGSTIVLATAEPVKVRLADHGIDAPEITGVAKVRDTGEFEFLVVLRRT
jgi:polyisoprenoid-binding protein YceI